MTAISTPVSLFSDVTANRAPAINFLTPTYRPAGGVVKIFDYVVHGLDLGYRAHVHCPVALGEEEPLFEIPRFVGLPDDPRVTFHAGLSPGVNPEDWVLFSWPPHYEAIARGMAGDTAHERVIHLVQGTRHGNPEFADGYALRLLARPMARVMVTHAVMNACRPHLNTGSVSTTILEGHDWGYFHRRRQNRVSRPLRVGFTTWKSPVGLRVEEALSDRELFTFRSIRHTASWREVRALLHWCDVFLSCPGPEEGFYLPGLEAMAAGAVVVTPDVGGNRAYCRFGENCLLVGFERTEDYVARLLELVDCDPGQVNDLRQFGYKTLQNHTLSAERAAFGSLLMELSGRTARPRFDPSGSHSHV